MMARAASIGPFVGSSVLVSIKSARDRFRGGSVFKPIDLTEQLDNLLAEIAEAVAPRSR